MINLFDIRHKLWYGEGAPINAVKASDEGTNLIFTAKGAGSEFDDIEIDLVSPDEIEAELSILVEPTKVTVSLATDETKLAVSTSGEVMAIINKTVDCPVTAELREGKDGNETEVAKKSALEGGQLGTVCQQTGVVVEVDNQLYINIAPNSKNDVNWRKLNLVNY